MSSAKLEENLTTIRLNAGTEQYEHPEKIEVQIVENQLQQIERTGARIKGSHKCCQYYSRILGEHIRDMKVAKGQGISPHGNKPTSGNVANEVELVAS